MDSVHAIMEVAMRIRELREVLGISEEDAAEKCDVSLETYRAYERGELDYSFTFIYKCSRLFGVDVTDIIKGSSPKLSSYSVTKNGGGLPIVRRRGFSYQNLAPLFKNKIAEPFRVLAKYDEAEQNSPIKLSTHVGQEYDYIIKGQLKVQIDEHIEYLSEGDSIYYDSATPHGMIAVGGGDCDFIAVIMNAQGNAHEYDEDKYITKAPVPVAEAEPDSTESAEIEAVMAPFVELQRDTAGKITHIEFPNADRFNFAYDVVAEMAKRLPDKRALVFLDRHKNERIYTFSEIDRYANMAANYFLSLGIKRGDRVMLVLRRHVQFWAAINALHKIGAVIIPATTQLLPKDYIYRFNAAGVSAVVATRLDGVPKHIEDSLSDSPTLKLRIVAGGDAETPEGWHDFDAAIASGKYSDKFERADDAPAGDDTMLMFFTSGTTGYPKIAEHSYKYALGHYLTAKYWHNVDPNGIHFTISDTGWGKALWGKLYGQWMCGTAVFVYDFDRFHADDILSVIEKYKITTFCAPPTMYRFMIKEDLAKYDLSSLKYGTVAGEALNPEVYNRFYEATGIGLMEGFGQTETTLTIANFIGAKVKLSSMGVASPQYDVMLIDENDKPVPRGETGEIAIKISDFYPVGLFKGYYNNEEETKCVMHDGFYHTGDTAWQDEDGYFFYVGRVDDVIKSSGYRIGPFEIESVIMELPYVLEVAVTAAKDEVRGNVVKATVVLTKGTVGTDELKREIQTYVKEHTAPYKYPRIVEFVDELPKTISGKIRRVEIRGEDKG